jgi:hypothetical protein
MGICFTVFQEKELQEVTFVQFQVGIWQKDKLPSSALFQENISQKNFNSRLILRSNKAIQSRNNKKESLVRKFYLPAFHKNSSSLLMKMVKSHNTIFRTKVESLIT